MASPNRLRNAIRIGLSFLLLAGLAGPEGRAAESAAPPENVTAKNLAKETERLRAGLAGKDPIAVSFLDKIEHGQASAPDLNAFAAYLAKKGLAKDALPVQQEAARLDPKNPILWLNVGTLQRDLGHRSEAMSAYKKALSLDPNNALAHYDTGVLLDADGNYDDALEEYRTAITIDPSLADPKKNPQILNNHHQIPLSILLYRQKAGAIGLPLVALPPAPVAPAPAAPAPKPASTEAPH